MKPASRAGQEARKRKPEAKAAAKPAPEPERRPSSSPPKLVAKQLEKPVACQARRQDRARKKPGETERPGDADSPLLDMSDVGVRKMIARAKQRGYVTYDELNKVLPSDKTSSEQIEDTMAMLNEMGINVIESEEAEEERRRSCPRSPKASKALATTAKTGRAI